MRSWMMVPVLVGGLAGAACGGGDADDWEVGFETAGTENPVRLFANCRFTLEIRLYQDNVQKLQLDLSSAANAHVDPPAFDFQRPARVRVFVKSVEGDCPPLQAGQIFYYPSADGWAPLEPFARGGRATFESFRVWFNPPAP